MNKADLIDFISSESSLTKKESEKALNAFLEAVRQTLQKGDALSLPGFGSFSAVKRQARTGHNPRTGEPIQIAASVQAKFTAGKALKDTLNQRA